MAHPPLSVLLFEDDEGQVILTTEALEKAGLRVAVARNGREGLDRLLNAAFDAYLVDYKLPDVPGLEVLRRIITMRPDAVVVMVTGHGDESSAVEAMKLGAYDYVVKSPYMGHLTMLPMVVHEACDRRRLRQEREQLQTELWEHARLLEERNAELRRANEELKRLDQMKSDLVSMVSHELRTPLATIKEFTGILADQIAGPVNADQQEYLHIVRANIDRLARIIDDLLDMAKIEAGRIMLNRGLVQIPALVEHVVQSMQPLADSRGVAIRSELPAALPGVLADGDKVAQVLINLLSNAIKYTQGAGQITMRVEEQTNEIQFSVADTGVGIAPDDLPKIFEKFQQFRRAVEPGTKGTGLGLAISKRLVELHGGRIWATSSPGKGSTFLFTLPKYHAEEVFREYIRTALQEAKRKQGYLSTIIVSVLRFQELKALYGLEETSRLLKDLEMLVRETVRRGAGDVVVRWQRGDMVVILAEVDKAGANAIADRIRRIVEGRTFTVHGKPLAVSLTASSVTYPDEATTEEELLSITESRLQQADRARTRIMVIDDEPKIRQFLKEALELREYEVLTAASGPEAIEQLKAQRVHLILLDVMMPVMDGYEFYHVLKETPQTADVPVIIVTARGERKDRQLGLETASYNYLSKPFQLEDLLAKVREVLQHHPVKA
ncbi:MAG: response regulator [Candidatus Omnitrophica bacterium]|nr:response regulator [Candidatus Omnitrophota bacterium]